jgi:Fic family protein
MDIGKETLYDDPGQFEPLVIADSRPKHPALIGLAHELCEASARLEGMIPVQTGERLSALVAGMNCYYSNLIEGHKTLPIDIEKAMHATHPNDTQLVALAVGHLVADEWARAHPVTTDDVPGYLRSIHATFCSCLPETLRTLDDGSVMVPGEFRRGQEVRVGQHVAPRADSINHFLNRFSAVYGRSLANARVGGMAKLQAVMDAMAAHHRLVWIHPFADGNGRVGRIMLDAMLRQTGVNPHRLWSMSRGFAKTQDTYQQRLAEADWPRMGDLDGRGNLSETKLADLIAYALETAQDQVNFMTQLFALNRVEDRCRHYFQNIRIDLKPQAVHLYLAAFTRGEFERMEAARLTGLPERTARNVLSSLLDEGFLSSPTPRGRVRVGFPVHALGTLFPNLYPAGDLDIVRPVRPSAVANACRQSPV